MALTHTYADEYLRPLVTEARETRAIADVADLGTLPAAWAEKLEILRAYIITCLDCGRAPGDLFESKLKQYRTEYADTLTAARAAQTLVDGAGAGSGPGFAVLQWERA